MAYEYIDHEAIIEEIDFSTKTLRVRIDDADECGDCPAASTCWNDGQPSNKISVFTDNPSQYEVGDIVIVRGTERMHRKAIMWATVLPCIGLVAIMVGIYLLTGNQLAAALSGLGFTFLSYLLLYFYRNKIAHEFNFVIIGKPERAHKDPEPANKDLDNSHEDNDN